MSEKINVSLHAGRVTIADRIEQEIDQHYANQKVEPYRTHLGWSVIGHECDRHIFMHFRWFKANKVLGRMRRLFNRGEVVESEIRQDLKAIGCKFLDTVDIDGKQIKVTDLNGHFGGSCDGIFTAPHLGLYDPTLLEAKSSGTGAKFSNLPDKRVEGSNKQHFIQQSGYGKALGIRYCLYIVENKNDSDRYYEMVELDYKEADEQVARAFHIINQQQIPPRLSKNPSHVVCKTKCEFRPLCFEGRSPDVNCRSCFKAKAIENSEWFCSHYNDTIPKAYIPNGCPHHQHMEEF